jgi:hypothetical protein
MICYEWRGSEEDTMGPSTGPIGQHERDRDHASRQQTFASEGDAIFLPKTAETLPTGRPLPFVDASSKSSNPYASFAAPPTMRNPNPFSNNNQVQARQQQQQAQQQQQTQSHFNMLGSTKPTSPNSHSPTTNPFLSQSSNGVSLLRTGTSTSEARGSTRSSPSLSVESTVGSTAQSSVKMSMSHQDASTTSTGSSTLPPIPDITSSNGQQAGQASTTRRSSSFVSISSSNQSQSNSNDGNGNGKGPLSFAPFISTAQMRNHPKTGHADILLQVIIQVSSTHGGIGNARTSHTIYKWYSDLRAMHERCGIHQKQISFPVIYSDGQPGANINENDRLNLQKYLTNVAESVLDLDYKSNHGQQVLNFFEDESHSLSDKIRMLLLESRLVTTMNYCEQLQNRLQIAEQNLSDSSNLVSFLRFRVEQLENMNSSQQRAQDEANRLQSEPYQTFQQQQKQQSAPSMHVTGYSVAASKTGVSYNNADTMFGKQVRIDDRAGGSTTFVSDNNVNPSQLVTLAEAVLNEKGPLPVGEVGKMLQEATGNPHLSQVLKERHNGLKKFLEKYSDKFIMSCDHPFNPHVYLRRSYSPDDQRMIENGSTAFLDKKVKKTRRKEKKTWPGSVPPSPTIGSYQY